MSKALAKKSTTITVAEGPPTFSNDAPKGYSVEDASKLPMPRFRLLQALSQAVSDKRGEPGHIENSLSGKIHDPEKEQFIFITFKAGAVYFEQGRGLVCKSDDGKTNTHGQNCIDCPHNVCWSDWGDSNEPPKCQETINFLTVRRETLLTKNPEIACLTFSSTSIKAGKSILANAAYGGQPVYANVYKLNVFTDQSGQNKYMNFKPENLGWIDQDEAAVLEKLCKKLETSSVVLHEEGAKTLDTVKVEMPTPDGDIDF